MIPILWPRTKPEKPITDGDKQRLKAIFERLLVQSGNHRENLVQVLLILLEVLDDEFREDNRPSLKAFAEECLGDAYKRQED